MNEIFDKRISSLKSLLNSSDEAFVLTSDVNIGYFSGFLRSEGVMLVTESESVLFVDFRYYEAAEKACVGCRVVCFKELVSELAQAAEKNGVKLLRFEASNISVKRYEAFKKELEAKSFECVADSELDSKINEIRSVKDEIELDKIQTAQIIAENAFLETLNFVKPGVKERELAARLEFLMKKSGAEKASFDLITITGKKTSLPHGVPGDDVVRTGDFVTFDFGAIYDGYCSDTTRTVAVGRATEEMKTVYDIVLKAQLAALEAIKPGAACKDVDGAARSVIESAGYGEYFGHSAGHGVGLEIHEAPAVSPKSEAVLKSGMVITDEPGIYLPDKFGVRIEDMVCVTDDGYDNFVNLSKELIIL